jgi:hypothetical protein
MAFEVFFSFFDYEQVKMLPTVKFCAGFHSLLHRLPQDETAMTNFIHEIFVYDPSVIKYVHLQMYGAEYIDLLVENVASMHVCFEFMEQFFDASLESSAGAYSRFIFGSRLLSSLSKRYPLAVRFLLLICSLSMVSSWIQKLKEFAKMGIRTEDSPLLLDSFKLISEAFPFMNAELLKAFEGELNWS